MAAGWFLAIVVGAFVLLGLLRGAGRFLLPLLAIGALAYVVNRFLKKLREPVD